jgi:hypothetical protein
MANKMVRIIVRLTTKKEAVYEVEKAPNPGDFLVKFIEFRRDGLLSVNHGAGANCSHYLIGMVNPMNDKDKIYKVIPYDAVEDIMFIEAPPEKKAGDEKSCETATEMKRV